MLISEPNLQFFTPFVTLKLDRWLWKTIGHLFYAIASFVHHSEAISEFKLELQSRNTQFESNVVDFVSCVTLKYDRWRKKSIGHLFYTNSGFAHHFIAIGELKLEL